MKRLGRKTVSAIGLLLAMTFAVFGVWALVEDDLSEAALPGAGSGGLPDVHAPRVIFDDAPPEEPASAAAPSVAPVDSAAPPGGDPDAKAQAPKVEDDRPALLRGKVIDKAGVGVAEATVKIRGRRDREGREVQTDGFGLFALSLKPGAYGLWAEKDGLAPSEGDWVRLGPGEDKTLKPLTLTPATALRGTVRTTDGQPLAGARVAIEGRRGQGREASTDPEGRFLLDGLGEGLHTVVASKEGYVPRTERDVPVTEEGGGEVAFTLGAAGVLTGVLRKQDGTGLSRGLVFAHWESERLGMTRSDTEGRFRMAGLRPGPVEVFARSEDYGLSVRGTTRVVAGQLTVQDLVLFEGPRITGVLRDAQGEAIVGMHVSAHSASGDVRRRDKSDEQGRYEIKNLYPGRYMVSVGGAGRGGGATLVSTEVEVVSGRLQRDLVVPTGAKISGVVVDAQGEAVKDANVFAIVGRDYRGEDRSDEAGRFSIEALPPGDYQLFVRVGDDRLVGLHPVSLREGETLGDLSLLVREPARLRGRVLDPQGRPVAGVVIDVQGGESPVRRRAETEDDGSFTIGPLYDGEYELTAREGPLTLLAAKWQVTRVTVEPFRFVIRQGQGLQQDLKVRVEQ